MTEHINGDHSPKNLARAFATVKNEVRNLRGQRGNHPMPKPQNKQAITATVKCNAADLTGIYWIGKIGGGWKREFFVVDESGEHIPWRRVTSWRMMDNKNSSRLGLTPTFLSACPHENTDHKSKANKAMTIMNDCDSSPQRATSAEGMMQFIQKNVDDFGFQYMDTTCDWAGWFGHNMDDANGRLFTADSFIAIMEKMVNHIKEDRLARGEGASAK